MAQEKFTPEAALHLTVHFAGVVILYWIVLFLPVWISVTLIIIEVLQMKYFGNCFLTVIAHKRGYMQGLSYWQYVPKLIGIKDYKKADAIISGFIKITLVGILLYRILSYIYHILV